MGFFSGSDDTAQDPSQSFWGDPGNQAAFGALAAVLQAGTAPRFAPNGNGIKGGGALNALAALTGAGMAGAAGGAANAQAYQQQNIANQSAQLNLQKQQAIQPGQIAMIQGAMGGSQPSAAPFGMPQTQGSNGASPAGLGGGVDVADQQFAQAYKLALASGDMAKASVVLQSWAEHNPQLAGAVKNAQEQNTYQKTPQGTYAMPSQGNGAFGNPAPQSQGIMPPAVQAQPLPTPPTPSQIPQVNASQLQPPQQRDAAFMPPTGQPTQSAPVNPNFVASDGKPIIPSLANNPFYKPTPDGTPVINTMPSANTETAVKTQEGINDAQIKNIYSGDATFTTSLASLQKEDYRIQQLMDIYHRTQSGTAVSQIPELANQLVSVGAISDPKTIKTVADAQTAANDHVLQILQQIKDTNQNLGSAPTRTFGSEIQSLQDNGETFKDQPEALYNILTQARGVVAQNMDMVKGWQAIGGTGNTAAGGKTMMPDQYAQQFMLNHDPNDYRQAIAAKTKPFVGMPNAASPSMAVKSGVTHMFIPGRGVVPVGQ